MSHQTMSPRLASLAVNPGQLAVPTAVIALILGYLGVSPLTALLSALSWVALGSAGAWLIQSLVGDIEARYRLPLVLGPGALLALGLTVFVYLSVQGGILGICLVVGGTVVADVLWMQAASASIPWRLQSAWVLVLVGLSLLGNSKEFPNLLWPAISILVLTATLENTPNVKLRVASFVLVLGALTHDVVRRAEFWWWSSDDTTTLSGIGTIIIERGNVAEIAGWQTTSHHWLLHAWLALWNLVSFGESFETYLIAWPVVASVSMFASLWIFVEMFLGRKLTLGTHLLVGTVVAGLVRLEWPAPQEQQPFLFAMVAVCALFLRLVEKKQKPSRRRILIGAALILAVIPSILIVLKPSLLVAYFLLILGVMFVRVRIQPTSRLFISCLGSMFAISLGILLMRLGGPWISQRSFTSFSVKWFPGDLGWCSYSSLPGSLACVISLQALLILSFLLAVGLLLVPLRSASNRLSMVILFPLVVAYLPLRYFISSDVGSGAPSFYRLSEMAMMLIVAFGVACLWTEVSAKYGKFLALAILSVGISVVSEAPNRVYDAVDAILVWSRVLRFLSPAVGIALVLALLAAIGLSRRSLFQQSTSPSLRFITTFFAIVTLLPIAQFTVESATAAVDPGRLSRPRDFGPRDIEVVGDWLRTQTPRGSVLATNYLCPESRLDDCRYSANQTVCHRKQPVLMASWALAALSRREFFYLSQMWDSHTLYYFDHRTSTRLGSELSYEAVRELQDLGVTYYVASKEHTNPVVWSKLAQFAKLSTEHFVIVSITDASESTIS